MERNSTDWGVYVKICPTDRNRKSYVLKNESCKIRYMKDLIRAKEKCGVPVLAAAMTDNVIHLLFGQTYDGEIEIFLRLANASFFSAYRKKFGSLRFRRVEEYCETEKHVARVFNMLGKINEEKSPNRKWNSVNFYKDGAWEWSELLSPECLSKKFEISEGVLFVKGEFI